MSLDRLVRRPALAALALMAASAVALPVSTAASVTPDLPGHAAGLTVESSGDSFAASEPIARTHLVGGNDTTVDTRNFSVKVDHTQGLRERQQINVSWTGAHPTGGVYNDTHAQLAAEQEYPVVVLECRGVDSASAPAAQQVSQSTCWTHTPLERFQYDTTTPYPPFRQDRYAGAGDRATEVGVPNPYPAKCSLGTPKDGPYGIQHWVPFVAVDGTRYPGGPLGCGGAAPEAANFDQSLQPDNTTFAASGTDGAGSAAFPIETTDSNASLGCSDKVACTLEVIPIEGISCDAAGDVPGTPADDRPPADQVRDVQSRCNGTDFYQPGAPSAGSPGLENVAVSGYLWWSASNWRNRVAVPLTLAAPANVCDLSNSSAPTYMYGSELMLQANLQWQPAFCLDPTKFKYTQLTTSEPQAKNLLAAGSIEAAIQAAPPAAAFPTPTVQAPIALTGFAIGAQVDGTDGKPYSKQVRLTPRLLAKMLTESYPGLSSLQQSYPATVQVTDASGNKETAPGISGNPLSITGDPEFKALNPGVADSPADSVGSAPLFTVSSDADVTYALTSYITADPSARAWLDGTPDPWGMVVNPYYRHLQLPVSTMPLLDQFADVNSPPYQANPCLQANPVPILPLISAPVASLARVTLDLQFSINNAQINCFDAGAPDQKLTALGRENPGERGVFGLIPVADAARYGIPTAALQSQVAPTAVAKFTDDAGRTFVGPTPATLAAASALLTPDNDLGTWRMPYTAFQTDPAAAGAYPGTLLLSADVPTQGLPAADAKRYGDFLAFAAGPGQVTGSGNGQLPAGYLPLTAANNLGAEAAYTLAASHAVAAQEGSVPSLTGTAVAPTGASPAPASTAGPVTGAPAAKGTPSAGGIASAASDSGFGGSTGALGDVTSAGSFGAGASPGSASQSAPSPRTGAAVSGPAAVGAAPPAAAAPVVARTPDVGAGAAALAVPLALGIALAAGVAALFTGGPRMPSRILRRR